MALRNLVRIWQQLATFAVAIGQPYAMIFNRKDLTIQELKHLHRQLVYPRLIEEKMLILLRQNRVSKWFSGIGQEAISVGLAQALHADEFILPLHRNLGVFTSRQLPLHNLFAQFQGKREGYSKGRDRSFHFGTMQHHIVGMISHLGPQLAVADGIALAHKLAKAGKVTAVFSGDGGSSEGDFHEALNVAAVWDLPVIFVVENNGYGLSTPSDEQFKFKSFTDKGPGYGMEAIQIDGNNILEVYTVLKQVAETIRNKPQPVLIEAMTFRMRGHEEASGTKYVPKHLFDYWERKDPVMNYEFWLREQNIMTQAEIDTVRAEIKKEIEAAVASAWALDEPNATIEEELADVYKPFSPTLVKPGEAQTEKRLVDAISDGLRQSMERHPNLILMGQDIAEYGGVFKITEGFVDKFGKDRVRNTPLCESAIVGTALGLSLMKHKAMVEMQFADFVTCGFNQIINNLAKVHYRWGENADVVVRMPTGAGVAAGPFHSQSNEAWFAHTPGLKVVYPSNPRDAKGLLCAAIEDPNPVIYFEHKALYRSLSGLVPDDYYTLPIGKAATARHGDDCTIITYGMGVHWALKAVEELNLDALVLDLRSLLPWDQEAVRQAAEHTGRVLVLHEDTLTGGFGGEIAAWVSEHCFTRLDAPVMRLGSLDSPIPFSPNLEKNFLANARLKDKLKALMAF